MGSFFDTRLKGTNDFSDSIYAMNGKSVEVDNTDAEGRLVLSGMIPFSDIL